METNEVIREDRVIRDIDDICFITKSENHYIDNCLYLEVEILRM